MTTENFYYAAYSGTKAFAQQDVQTSDTTGFGAAADDYAERGIDLNEQLIKNKPATYFMRVNSDAMKDAGIHRGDVVIVDRSLEARDGKVVIAVVDGELLIRKLKVVDGKKKLALEKNASVIELNEQRSKVWGVVTYVIHNV